jgi:hypothetical protein
VRLEATPYSYRTVRLCGCTALAKRGITTRLGRYVEAKVPKVAAKLNRVFAQAAKRAIAAYRAKMRKADEDIVKAILAEIDPLGLSQDLADAITPDMIEAYKVGGITGALDVLDGPSPGLTDQIDAKAIGWAAERGGELIKQLNETTVDDLRDFLSEAVAAGMGPEDLADAVDELGAFGEARSILIARTELAFAHVQGNLQGWRETGQVEGKRSILGDTHEIVDECDDAVEAGVVPLDEEIIPGYVGPPYHPACLCDLVPVLTAEED